MAMATVMDTATVARPRRLVQREFRVAAGASGLGLCQGFVLAWAALVALPAGAQGSPAGSGGSKPTWVIAPRLSLTETWTDNGRLSASGNDRGSEQITQVSPGIRMQGRTARINGYLDYSLNQLYYAQNSQANKTQNSLNAFGSLEAVDKFFYVDAGGNISQTSVSAFGTQSSTDSSINANSTETSSFRLSPYVRGELAGYAHYLLRYTRSTTRSDGNTSSNSESDHWNARLNGGTGLASLSWAFDVSRQSVARGTGRETESDRLHGDLFWQPEPQWRVRLSAGRESNNFASPDKESHVSHGYGVDWRPAPRTDFSIFRERRFFGDAQTISLSHRTPRTAWRYNESRDVSSASQSGLGSIGTLYDLVLAMVDSAITDPLDRAAEADRYFQLTGLPRDAKVYSNFLSSQESLSRRRSLTFAMNGVRNTVTFTASQNRREVIVDQFLALLSDSFSQAKVIEQRGFTVNWAHKLTPQSSLSAGFNASTTTGTGGSVGDIRSTQKTLNVTYSTKLGAHTSASLGLRRTVFDSDSQNATNYTDNSVTGALTAHF